MPLTDTDRVLVGHALASVGMSLPWPLLLVLVWDSTHSDLLLGATGAARMLPYVVLSWAAGRLADARRRDQVVRATVVARVGALVLAAGAIALDQLLSAVLACTAAIAVGTPAYPALAAALPGVAGGRQARATELLVTIEIASFVVGPALGGLLLWPPTRAATPAVAVALVAGAWLLLRRVDLPAAAPSPGEAGGRSVRGILRGRVVRTIGVMAAVNLVVSLVAVALIPMVERLWGGGATAYGVATGALGFGALGGPLLVRLGRTDPARVGLGLVLMGVLLVGVAPTPTVAFGVLPLAVVGAAAVHVEAAATRMLQEDVPDPVRASALGLTDSAMVAAAMIGSLSGPLLVDLAGPRLLLMTLATLAILAGVSARSTPVVLVRSEIH
jgi:MFS family permease